MERYKEEEEKERSEEEKERSEEEKERSEEEKERCREPLPRLSVFWLCQACKKLIGFFSVICI